MTPRDLPLAAVIAFDFETWDIHEEIALLRDVGIGRVQIYRNYAQGITADDVRETLDPAGLVIDSLHGYFQMEGFDGPACDLSSANAALRRASLDLMRGEARFARALGCRDIIVHPVGPNTTRDDPGRRDALAHSARALAQLGEAAGVRFLIENMPPPMFASDAPTLRAIADEVRSPALGLAYDSGHAALAGDPVGTIHTMGPHLGGVHLHDNGGSQDDHLIPGMGVIPFEDVARALAAVAYRGTFILEIYVATQIIRRDLTPKRLAFIEHLRRLASGYPE